MGGSHFNAIISGRAAVALLTDDFGVYALDLQVNQPVACAPEVFNWLFGMSRDFEFIEDSSCEQISQKLTAAIRREESLDLALTLLERRYDRDIRRNAAEELNEKLRDHSIVESLGSIMHSAPLPPGTDLDGAQAAVPQTCSLATRWLNELRQRQSTVQMVHDAWNAIPNAVLSPIDRDNVEAACVRAGAFHQLVLAVEAFVDIEGVFASLARDPTLGRRVPNALMSRLLPAWKETLQKLRPQASPIPIGSAIAASTALLGTLVGRSKEHYVDPVVLRQLFLRVHSELHGANSITVYESERAYFASAFARAAIDMELFARTKNRSNLINGVARLAVAVANFYAEGKATAFVLTDTLLSEAGLQLPQDDYHLTRLNFEVLVQTKRVSEVVELLDRHWH